MASVRAHLRSHLNLIFLWLVAALRYEKMRRDFLSSFQR